MCGYGSVQAISGIKVTGVSVLPTCWTMSIFISCPDGVRHFLKFSASPRRRGIRMTGSICRSPISSRVPSEKGVLMSFIHYL